MSADNYTWVGRTDNRQFGIWVQCSASDEALPRHSPALVLDDAARAIIAAHRIEKESPTEYGVILGNGVLEAAEKPAEAPAAPGRV